MYCQKYRLLLAIATVCTLSVAGCKSESPTPEAAKQKAEAKETMSKIPPQVRIGGGPGR